MHRTQQNESVTVRQFAQKLRDKTIRRVPGKAIFLTRLRGSIPPVISDHVKQMGTFYEDVVALTVDFAERPRIQPNRRIHVKQLEKAFGM
jgi:KUP system potassium uptake protein